MPADAVWRDCFSHVRLDLGIRSKRVGRASIPARNNRLNQVVLVRILPNAVVHSVSQSQARSDCPAHFWPTQNQGRGLSRSVPRCPQLHCIISQICDIPLLFRDSADSAIPRPIYVGLKLRNLNSLIFWTIRSSENSPVFVAQCKVLQSLKR
jgi:hypothetical protein